MKQAKAIVFLIIAMTPTMALANPIDPTPMAARALLSESLILGLILGVMGFDIIRVIYTWIGVTFLTWLLLMIILIATNYLPENMANDLIFNSILIIGELLIVVVEAWVLRHLTRNKFFHQRTPKPLTWPKALGISLFINLVSFFAGML